MNDDMNVNVWQDGVVTERDSSPSANQVAEQTAISTVEQLKALADPTRLAILETLMNSARELPVMSVKELAEALHEPQTKLYRHVRVLESAGLIKIAATRMVSGIAEQRYQARQRDLDFAAGLMRQHVDEAEAFIRAGLDLFRSGFLAARRAETARDDGADAASPETTMLIAASGRRTPAEVAAIRASLSEALARFRGDDSEDPEAVPMHVLAGYFVEVEGEPG
jgi:DNA-binding transcriptional ArsR family regulator